jgi:hypothetical protein
MGDLMLSIFLPIALGAATPAPAVAAEPVAASQTLIVERTYLKALPDKRDALAKFIIANWFAMDQVAVEQGLFTSYRLYENLDADADWDFEVSVGYPNADGYENPAVQTRFTEIRKRHQTILIDGQSLQDLGTIVRSGRVRPREGSLSNV